MALRTPFLALSLLVLVTFGYAPGIAGAATPPACTINGSGAGTVITGTPGNDVICGNGGSDVIYGGGGKDILRGGTGNDVLYGQGDDDNLQGEAGNDRMLGGPGKDFMEGGTETDTVDYSPQSGAVTVTVGAGGANDGLNGGAEGDTVRATVEAVRGGSGNDDITGDASGEVLDGGAGNDTLRGLGGTDRFVGGPGGDTFQGGSGSPDAVDYSSASARVIASIGIGGANDGTVGEGDWVQPDIEYLIGSKFDDHLTGNGEVNILYGGAGDDDLFGGGGNDSLLGGLGADEFDGGADTDTVTYADIVTGGVSVSVGNAADGDGRASEGDDVQDSVEWVIGTMFGDQLSAGAGGMRLDGLGGDDTIVGGGGIDILNGGSDNDALLSRDSGASDQLNCGLGDQDSYDADEPPIDVVAGCEFVRAHATPDATSTDEDTAVGPVDVLGNDDGDGLVLGALSSQVGTGTFSSGVGGISYTPAGYDHLAAGDSDFAQIKYATTGTAGSSSSTFTVTVNGVNDAPTIATPSPANSYTEGSASPVAIDGQTTVSDVDDLDQIEGATVKISFVTKRFGDTLELASPSSKIDAQFSDGPFSSPTLTLTSKAGETPGLADWVNALRDVAFATTSDDPGNSREFEYSVSDGTASGTATQTMFVNSVNDEPTDLSVSASSIAENQPSGTTVGTLSTTDADDSSDFAYALAGGTDDGDFDIDGATLKTSSTFDRETKDSYSIRVRSTDFDGGSFQKDLTITVSDVDEAPAFTSTASPSAPENTLSAVDVDADDPEGAVTTYALSGGADDDHFTIDSGTGALEFKTAPDFEGPTDAGANNVYNVQVSANDGTTSPTTQDIAITVTDVNEAPTGLTLDDLTVDENHPAGTNVGEASATDPEGDALTYSLVSGAGDDDNAKFQFGTAAGELDDLQTAVANLNYEDASDADDDGSYQVRIAVSDGTSSTEDDVTITVNDLNDAPTAVNLSSSSIPENEPANTTVGTLTTTDEDSPPGPFTYELVSGTGDSDNGQFEIQNVDQLKAKSSFDYEAKNSYSIRVKTIDNGGPEKEQQLTISVTNVNEPPVIGGLESADLAYVENEDKQLTNALSLSDPESDTISSATVRLTTGHNSAEDRLKFTDSSTVVKDGSFDTSTGTLTLKGKDNVARSLAEWQTALRAVTYENLSQDPDEAKRTLVFRVTDTGTTNGAADPETSGPATRDMTVDRVNDAPVADHETGANRYPGALGNTRYVMSPDTSASGPHTRNSASGDVLDGDTDVDTPVANLTAGPATITSAQCTALNAAGHACANNVTMEPDGEFVYDPPAGYTGDDSFSYTVNDNDTGDGDTAKTHTGNVEADVAGPMVWYVDKDASTTGHGTSHAPLPDLPRLNPGTANTIDGRDGTGDRIFVYASGSNYTGGIQLEASQSLLGEPNGLSVQHSETNATHNLVSSGGSNPTITNAAGDAINLANNTEVQRVNIGTTSQDGIDGTNVDNATIGNGMTFSGIAGTDFRLVGGNGAVNIASPITNTAGRAIHVENRTGGAVQFNANVTDTGEGIFLDNNDNAIVNFPQTITSTIDTAHEAFAAEDGGTVMAPNANNTINHTGGARAIRVENTTIGAGGLDFQSVSSNGGENGIKLNNTGTTAGLTVHGNSTSAETTSDLDSDGSGGTLQNSTSHAIDLANTKDPLFDNLNITGPNRAGVKGTGVENFSYTDGVLTNVGDSKSSEHDAAFAFNPVTSNAGDIKGDRIRGTFTVKRNNVQSPYGGGVAVRESDNSPALTDVQVTDNTFQSATAHADSQGDGISFYVEGDGANVGRLEQANLSTNVIRNFPNGQGIELIGGNIDSTSAPRGALGVPGSSTKKIVVNGNLISGDPTTKMAAFGIAASVSGRSEGNVEITNNGTLADPVANMIGEGIAAGASGDSVATFVMTGNVLRPNNNLGNVGMSVNGDKRAFTAGGELMTPNITTTIANNNIAQTSGAGIHLKNYTSNATHKAKVMNNTVNTLAAPTQGNPGIRIENGSTNDAGFNPTLCVQAENNNTTGSATSTVLNAGIHILNRRAGVGSGDFYPLQLVGFGQTNASGQAAVDYLETKNPQSSSYAPIAGSFSIVSNPLKKVTSATSGSGSPTFDSCNAF